VSVNRVRELMSAAQIQPQRYSSLWSAFTGEVCPKCFIEKATNGSCGCT
jgi:hypothetical protein